MSGILLTPGMFLASYSDGFTIFAKATVYLRPHLTSLPRPRVEEVFRERQEHGTDNLAPLREEHLP